MLIVESTRTVEHAGWVAVLDIMGSPKLPRMAFPTCDRRDTEEVTPQVDFGWGVIVVFAQIRLARPSFIVSRCYVTFALAAACGFASEQLQIEDYSC